MAKRNASRASERELLDRAFQLGRTAIVGLHKRGEMKMAYQMSIFDGDKPFKIDKPIRLITLFSGYDSQALALKYLGVPFEHYRTCEWAIPSIQALHDLHFAADTTDYSAGLNKEELVVELESLGISADYNQPLTADKIKRYGEQKLRTIYNNIKSAHNLVSIVNAKGTDLGVVDTNKYCYIMTYSFPCQDLSNAGLQKGMSRDSGTRSGLLWEVERLLKECRERATAGAFNGERATSYRKEKHRRVCRVDSVSRQFGVSLQMGSHKRNRLCRSAKPSALFYGLRFGQLSLHFPEENRQYPEVARCARR